MDRPAIISVSIDGGEAFEVHIDGESPVVKEFADSMSDEEFEEWANSEEVHKEGNSLKAYIAASIEDAVNEYFDKEVND